MSPNLGSFAGPSSRAYNLNRGEGIKLVGKVGEVFVASAASVTIAVPVSQAVPAGTTVLLYARGGGGNTQAMTSASDSKGNTYVRDVFTNQSATSTMVAIFSGFITTALTTSDTITVTYLTTGTNRSIGAFNFSGIDPSSTSRLADSGNVFSSTNATISSSLTTTFANRGDLVFSTVGTGSSNTSTNAYVMVGPSLNPYGTAINLTTASAYAGGAFYISPDAGSRLIFAGWGVSGNWGLGWASYRAVA